MVRTVKKDVSWIVIACAMVATTVFAYYLYSFASGPTEDPYPSKFVTIDTTEYSPTLPLASLVLCFVGCIACYFVKGRKKWFAVIPTLVLLASPMFVVLAIFEHGGDFHDGAMVKGADGQEYHLLVSHFMQGSEIALGRLESKSATVSKFEKLADSPWEESWGYLTIIRPAQLADQKTNVYGTNLYISSDNILLGSFGNHVYVAFDLTRQIAYSQFKDDPKKHHVRELSSFLLLGPEDTPSEQDIKDLPSNNEFGLIEQDSWRHELNNPNPKVRELAQRALKPSYDNKNKLIGN